MPYRFKKDSWQPARWRRNDHFVLMLGLIVIAYIRGIDYLIGKDEWASKDFMIAAAPEWVWGFVGFIMGAAILSYGITSRRHLFVYAGHWWLGIAYGLNSLAAVLAAGPPLALPLVLGAGLVIVAIIRFAHVLTVAGHGTLGFLLSLAGVAGFGISIWLSHSFDGIRGGGAVGLVAVIHIMQAFRTGARPLRPQAGEVAETIVSDGGTQ